MVKKMWSFYRSMMTRLVQSKVRFGCEYQLLTQGGAAGFLFTHAMYCSSSSVYLFSNIFSYIFTISSSVSFPSAVLLASSAICDQTLNQKHVTTEKVINLYGVQYMGMARVIKHKWQWYIRQCFCFCFLLHKTTSSGIASYHMQGPVSWGLWLCALLLLGWTFWLT